MKDIFKNIFSSATRLVFIIIAIALVWFTQQWIIEWKDFFTIVAMVFTAYYSKNNKENDKKDNNTNP
jgi:hypothetical protein